MASRNAQLAGHLSRVRRAVWDVDDVLLDLVPGCLRMYPYDANGRRARYRDVREYNLAKAWGIPRDQALGRIHAYYLATKCTIAPMPGAVEAFALYGRVWEQDAVTGRHESGGLQEVTLFQMETIFKLEAERVQFCSHGCPEGSPPREKLDLCIDLRADLLIDDLLRNARPVAEAGIPVVLIDKPWNQCPREELHPLIYRVKSLHKMMEIWKP